ncbi:polysaccharide pyruvyl transferase family protein [Sphingomonas azotifigens]|uniref:polysaccharide pyruvyl transferase family protein n=1 Tax=Sphingomonas azotifigens TaxID=330920 RepID=UPI000A01F26A|nr:polysaccharide pyruvyl transferase family protein [Sphingomonas azotifigens]
MKLPGTDDSSTRLYDLREETRSVGILTFHRCINYGSYWQARCLVEGVHARGHHVMLLDHESPRVTRAEWRGALQPTLPVRASAEDRRRYGAKLRKFLCAFDALPLSPGFDLVDPIEMPHVDTVLVGSDEVWNLRHPWYGGASIFFGQGLNAECVAAYAASFGSYDADAGLDPYWQDQLRRFDMIAVRDENSQRLVQEAIGRIPALVLDPCLQFPPAADAATPVPEGRYGLVYGHGLPQDFAEAARRWAAARGIRLISIGYRNDWADEQWLDAGPHDFAAAMAGADAVLTNFFHGCVFALVNGVPFACATSSYRMNKVRDLTALLGAERHLLVPGAPINLGAILDVPLDDAIAGRILAMRDQSNAYLDKVLG